MSAASSQLALLLRKASHGSAGCLAAVGNGTCGANLKQVEEVAASVKACIACLHTDCTVLWTSLMPAMTGLLACALPQRQNATAGECSMVTHRHSPGGIAQTWQACLLYAELAVVTGVSCHLSYYLAHDF